MVTCNCPNCGGTIKPEEDRFGTCPYCGTRVYITPKNVYVDSDDPDMQDRMMEEVELEEYYVSQESEKYKKSGRAIGIVMGVINFFFMTLLADGIAEYDSNLREYGSPSVFIAFPIVVLVINLVFFTFIAFESYKFRCRVDLATKEDGDKKTAARRAYLIPYICGIVIPLAFAALTVAIMLND